MKENLEKREHEGKEVEQKSGLEEEGKLIMEEEQ